MIRTGLVVVAAVMLTACGRGQEYDAAGGLDTTADTTARLNVPDVDVGLQSDTINVPTLGMEKDTIVVSKPVVTGKKAVEVKRPTVDVNKKP